MLLKLPIEASLVGNRFEVEVLLISASTQIYSKKVQQLRILLQEDINWADLIEMATRHKVMPLLYWNLKATCPEAVPKAILTKLRADFRTNSTQLVFKW